MPEYATFHNTIFDIRCSKCKRTQENQFFVQNGRVYKTCNTCRARARVVRMDPETLARLSFSSSAMGPARHIPDSDSESEPSVNPRAALYALGFGARRAPSGFSYIDTANALRLSSAAAAASSSSAEYFVEEPDPEPEPEGS
jgi:hypothetical protein